MTLPITTDMVQTIQSKGVLETEPLQYKFEITLENGSSVTINLDYSSAATLTNSIPLERRICRKSFVCPSDISDFHEKANEMLTKLFNT